MFTVRAQVKICFDKFFVVYWRTPEVSAQTTSPRPLLRNTARKIGTGEQAHTLL